MGGDFQHGRGLLVFGEKFQVQAWRWLAGRNAALRV